MPGSPLERAGVPGTVVSGWHEHLVGAEAAQRNFEAEAGMVPMGRRAGTEGIAGTEGTVMAIAAAAPDMTFVTRRKLIVDGGKAPRN